MKYKHGLISILDRFPKYEQLKKHLNSGECPVSVFGLSEAHKAHILSGLFTDTNGGLLFALPTEADCVRYESLFGQYGINAVHFPAKSISIGIDSIAASGGTQYKRIEVLCALLSGKPMVVLASAEALIQKLAPPSLILESQIKMKMGDIISLPNIMETLVNSGYERVDMCESKGQFAVRGGRIDVFSVNSEYPVRIELFDDEIDSMRTFDTATQRSIENVREVCIYPASETPVNASIREKLSKKANKLRDYAEIIDLLTDTVDFNRIQKLLPLLYDEDVSLLDYMSKKCTVAIDEPVRFEESAQLAHSMFSESVQTVVTAKPSEKYLWNLYYSSSDIFTILNTPHTVMFFMFMRTFSAIKTLGVIQMDAQSVPQYMSSTESLSVDVKSYIENNYTIIICAGENAKQLHDGLCNFGISIALTDKIDRDPVPGEHIITPLSMLSGYEYREYRFVVITENELYGFSTVKAGGQTRAEKKKPEAKRLSLSSLSIGDYIVHDKHGIGRFAGIEALTVEDKTRDYILLLYDSNEKLYIPTDQLDRVQKYVGSDDFTPKLSKLGTNEWQRTVATVKAGVKALAFDLVKLYGERIHRKGHAYPEDTVWQRELEDSFPFRETADQLTCIEEIKADMESDKIMDRLLCGDVGFGKTEVALRAAFKAAMDSKQVAFLVPTTILAHQHYNTLATRFANFPVKVDYISRFKTAAEQQKTLKRLAHGEIDIVVGTHRILSKDVKFKDLGLLIIDEEQRFGVGHKEMIKELKKDVDVLTLTATPIPRTLHMSLIGIRDISVIDTPPSRRYPVQTYVTEYSDTLVSEAVLKEVGRGGQVFFLYNNVRNMDNFYSYLSQLLPTVRIKYAHGQMSERQLERTMLEFLNHEFDLLLCSTIIENGLDISNANTIIVYDSDKFGLSQLYQLRGRVGRSTRLGYAYLTFKKNKVFTEDAQKRLQAIKEFTQLGMGYRIAISDLQIRGAGDVLGPMQHGHMVSVGYELYRQLMSEAVSEAKGVKTAPQKPETLMDVPINAFIPRSYIEHDDWRLDMYKRIAAVKTTDDAMDITDELIDRYGDLPKSVDGLLSIALLKSYASECYITKVKIRDAEAVLTFDDNVLFNVDKLLALLNNTPGTQLINGSPTELYYRKRGTGVNVLIIILQNFLLAMRECLYDIDDE